jgi:hypothetical protein
MALGFLKRKLTSFLLALYKPFERGGASDLAKWILVHWGLDALPYILRSNNLNTDLIIDSICHRLEQKPDRRCVPALINLVKSTTNVSARCRLLYTLRDIGGPQAMAFLIDMRKDPTERPDVALHIRQIAEKEVQIAKCPHENADITYIPALISLVKSMPQEYVSRDRSPRHEILEALGLLGGREAIAALIDMLEDPMQWMKEDIAWQLEKSASNEILTPELSTRLAQVVERAILKEHAAWPKMIFPVLTRCMTREAERVLRLGLRKGPTDAVLDALGHLTHLDPSWLDDVLPICEGSRQKCSLPLCRVLGRIPDSRSLEILLKLFTPSTNAPREVAEAINYMAGGSPFPLGDAARAELERVLRESWEMGSYRLQAEVISNLSDKIAATTRFNDPDTPYYAQMLKLWTTEKLEKVLLHLSPSDGLLDIAAIPKAISYFEGTLEEILHHLQDYDKANFQKYPRLHEKKPYFCGKHLAVISSGWEFSSDFYGTITVALFRWKCGTYGCCSYDHSPWLMIPRGAETLGLSRFLEKLASAKAER